MNDRHAFVTYGDKGRVLFEQSGRPPLFLEKQTFLDMYANQMKELGKDKDGDTIKMAMGKWWFQKAERRQYERVFTIIASVAAFERDILIERTMEGLATARAKGVRLGRPPASDGLTDAIRALRLQKVGINSIAKELKCGKSTVA